MLLKDIIDKGILTLSPAYPEMEAREMVFILLEHILGTKKHTHIIEPAYEVSEDKVSLIEKAFMRLSSGEPLQYVIGKACFYGREFAVSPSVLIPRPETEVLCRIACGQVAGSVGGAGLRILDLCTGSGCIAWTMALEKPGARVTAADISDEALKVASTQVFYDEMQRTGALAPRFVKADILSDEVFATGRFDLILSNPPYVMDKEKVLMRTNVLDYEPHLALFVSDGDPLLFYRAIARWAEDLLAPGGTGIVEINEALGEETAKVFADAGFSSVQVLRDLSERDRFVMFRRVGGYAG